jgi:hypothetical protein
MAFRNFQPSSNQNPLAPRARSIINTQHAGYTIRGRQLLNQNLPSTSIRVYKPLENATDNSMYSGQPVFEDVSTRSRSTAQYPITEGTLNDLTVSGYAVADLQKARLSLYQRIRFIGINLNNVRYDPENSMLTDNSACMIEGMSTVVNTGSFHVTAGDIMCYQLPSTGRVTQMVPTDGSIPKSVSYRQLELVPLQHAEPSISDKCFETILSSEMMLTLMMEIVNPLIGFLLDQVDTQRFLSDDISQAKRNEFEAHLRRNKLSDMRTAKSPLPTQIETMLKILLASPKESNQDNQPPPAGPVNTDSSIPPVQVIKNSDEKFLNATKNSLYKLSALMVITQASRIIGTAQESAAPNKYFALHVTPTCSALTQLAMSKLINPNK